MRIRNITSEKNQIVKGIRLLNEKRGRDKEALFFVEGHKFVLEGLTSGWDVVRILVDQSYGASPQFNEVARAYSGNEPIYSVPDKLFRDISDTTTPQGVLAVFRQKRYTMSDILKGNRLIVVLDCIQDPGNMGTIIRTTDAAAFTGVVCLKGCTDIYAPKVVRSTAGSIFHIPVIKDAVAKETLPFLQNAGIKVYTTGTGYLLKPYDVGLEYDTAIIIGNEAAGVSPALRKLADAGISLPIPGTAESYNASIAAGMIMYESIRQREGKGTLRK